MKEYRNAALVELNRIGMQALRCSFLNVGTGALVGYGFGCIAQMFGAGPGVSEKVAVLGTVIGGMRAIDVYDKFLD